MLTNKDKKKSLSSSVRNFAVTYHQALLVVDASVISNHQIKFIDNLD